MLVGMLTLGFGMFSLASFNYDEFNKADRYILTLPLTKKEVVRSKYILVIGSTIIGSLMGILLTYVVSYLIIHQIPDIESIISAALGGILGIGTIEAIQIPCIYKWGAEKGRIQMVVLTALLGVIIFLGASLSEKLPLNNVLNALENFIPAVFAVLAIVNYYISYRVAYKIYEKKEV